MLRAASLPSASKHLAERLIKIRRMVRVSNPNKDPEGFGKTSGSVFVDAAL
jgi:hypothetical protein